MNDLYPNLILALRQKHMTQKDLAAALKISERGMSKKMNGEFDFWLSEARQICGLLDVTEPEEMINLFQKD